MKLLEEINSRGTTVVVVTHNLEIVKAMNKRVITMKKGVVVEDSEGDYSDEDQYIFLHDKAGTEEYLEE